MLTSHTYMIRPSEIKDAAQLMELDALVWDKYTSPEPLNWRSRQQYLQHCPPGSQLIAVQGERVCGYVGFHPATGMPVNRHVYEINIAVHPHDRRCGMATALMDAMKQYALEQGITKLRLRVLSSNPGAIAFYTQSGFVTEGRLMSEFYIAGKYVDDILMSYFIQAKG
ncbi:MAG TPA: N-acetyltransferase [Paenibacillus sp.]|uniref:GNAT family N-acetyltransferase n=1 Tax=Paenibacillus TaxID=44249 RepID=UPI000BA0C2D8|nr:MULTISPECIES: GNAT family N-acetyltransferase [Paenibacillus]OZQ64798.1 GNAT family N-acetyltransferase [Paenibacillus taichungensis]HBU81040.1 N-acetyltransferase [Paenibacillus sp.]